MPLTYTADQERMLVAQADRLAKQLEEYTLHRKSRSSKHDSKVFAWIKHVLGFEAGLSAAQILL